MLGKKHTEEAKARISRALRANPPPNPMRGKKHTEETKAKMSATRKGRAFTPEHRAKIAATLKAKRERRLSKAKL